MKTYFDYESIIKSKDAAEAIASPVGLGPFCGFGSATIANQAITIRAQGLDGTITRYPIADRIRARQMYKGDEDISTTNFGVVAADGTVYTDSAETIAIPTIQGTEGVSGDVIVFAVHQQVTEPVNNPVSFVAYHSASSTSFYELYKRSQDPYYPSSESQEFSKKDIFEDQTLSYANLCSMVESAVGNNIINWDTMVLVGIYGRGTDAETETSEDFAIVPYGGQFPQPLPYNTAVYGAQQKQAKMIQQMMATIPSNQSLVDFIRNYINSLLGSGNDETSPIVSIPPGTIVLYNGTTAPEGWALCDGTNGTPDLRGVFVIGAGVSTDGVGYNLSDRGGNREITLAANQLPSHKHEFQDWYYLEARKAGAGPTKDYGYFDTGVNDKPGSNGGYDTDNRYAYYYTHDTEAFPTGSEQEAVNILPPYVAMNYIMKL